jgi:transposase InsO family protein
MDVMYVPATSYHKYEYIVVIVDDFSSYSWIGLIKTKDKTLIYFKNWYTEFVHTKHKIIHLRSDRGGEFINKAFDKFLKEKGIKHLQTTPYTPQQNGTQLNAVGSLI